MFALGTNHGHSVLTPLQWRLAIATLLLAAAEGYAGLWTKLTEAPAWLRTPIAVLAILAIEIFSASDQAVPFVYFQF